MKTQWKSCETIRSDSHESQSKQVNWRRKKSGEKDAKYERQLIQFLHLNSSYLSFLFILRSTFFSLPCEWAKQRAFRVYQYVFPSSNVQHNNTSFRQHTESLCHVQLKIIKQTENPFPINFRCMWFFSLFRSSYCSILAQFMAHSHSLLFHPMILYHVHSNNDYIKRTHLKNHKENKRRTWQIQH